MYASAVDCASLAGVGVRYGQASGDVEHQALVDSIQPLADRSGARTGVFILVSGAGDHTPDAEWRRRFGAQRSSWKNHRFALVTRSTFVRGALTAINWIAPQRDGQRARAFAEFDAARAWIELERGEPMPILDDLYRRARAAADLQEADALASIPRSA